MFCEQCGNKVPEDAKFCPKCGTPCSDDNNVPENNGGTKAGKKPKKRRKKNKAVIALCTAVVVVGASVGGFVLYKNYEKRVSAQRAVDLMENFAGLGMGHTFPSVLNRYLENHEDTVNSRLNCKINYDALTKDEKKEFDKMYPEVEEHYTFYPTGNSETYDVYTDLVFETKGISDNIKKLSKNDYSYASVTSYRIEKGKIYAELDVNQLYSESKGIYKFEGELAPNEIPYFYETDYLRKNKKNVQSFINSHAENIYEEPVKFNFEDELKEYENYLKKWETAAFVGDEGDRTTTLFYRIKDYKDGTLIIEDCFRRPQSFQMYVIDKYYMD